MTLMGQRFAYRERTHTPGDPEPPVEVVKEDPRRSHKVKGTSVSPRSLVSARYGGRQVVRLKEAERPPLVEACQRCRVGGEVR